MKLPIEILDEIFRFTEKPSFVLYFKKFLSRQTIRLLYRRFQIDKQAEKGNLQTLKYLHLIGAKCTETAMDWASNFGHLEIVKYLHETIGAKCTIDAMDWAIEYNCLEVVRYLHTVVGCNKYSEQSIILANYYGHTEVVKYLSDLKNYKPLHDIVFKNIKTIIL